MSDKDLIVELHRALQRLYVEQFCPPQTDTFRLERFTRAMTLARKVLEKTKCSHAHYDFIKHGRGCTCGKLMIDPGD